MAHHFSMRFASLALAAVTALGVSSAVPAFADTHQGGSQEQRSAMRFDNDHNHNHNGEHHRRGDCREEFRKEHNWNENNRRNDCEVFFHHKFMHKHHDGMEPRREFMMSHRH